MSFKSLVVVSSLALCACASSAAVVQPEVDRNSPDKAAAPAVKPAPVVRAPQKLSPAPEVIPFEAVGRPTAPTELSEVAAVFDDKHYFDAVPKLEEHHKASRAGSIDYQLQTYAMTGFAHAMMGETDLALRSYRRVLSKWQHPKSLASKLRRTFPDDADVRIERSMAAFGEALFFMAERKRKRLEEVSFPYNDVGDEPEHVAKFYKTLVKRWLRQREQRTRAAVSAYQRIDKITPEPPLRWVSASHARQGLMYAQTLQLLRDDRVPSLWEEEGESTYTGPAGAPLTWQQIRRAHAERVDALMKPLLEKARASFQACVDVAAGGDIDNPMVRECKRWLKANAES